MGEGLTALQTMVIAVSLLTFDTVHFFLEVQKKSCQMLMMLTKALMLQNFIFCIFKYVIYIYHLCQDSQTTAYMKNVY